MDHSGASKLVSCGATLPKQKVTGNELMDEIRSKERYGLPSRYFSTLMGIQEIRHAPEGTLPSQLAIEASLNALSTSGVSPMDIDCVIFCGIERDWQEPATAHKVQMEIGAARATCFDVVNACHGFMNGVVIADSFIRNGSADNVLVCTGEVGSNVARNIMHQINQRSMSKEELKLQLGALSIGDAGGAMIIGRGDKPGNGFQRFRFASKGEHSTLCHYKHGDDGLVDGVMDMQRICLESLEFHKQEIQSTYDGLDWQPADVNRVVAHQAGLKPHKWLMDAIGIPEERSNSTIERFGNIATATIPVSLSLEPPKEGDKVLILSTGSGLTIGQTGLVI